MRDLDEGGGTMSRPGTRNDLSGAHQRSRSRRGGYTGERDSGYTCGQREHGRARAGLPWPAVVVAAPDLKTCAGMKIDEIKIGWSRTV